MLKKINLITNFNSENIFQMMKNTEKKLKHFSYGNILDVLNKNNNGEDVNIIIFLQSNSIEINYLKKISEFSQQKKIKSLNILIPVYFNFNEILSISVNKNYNSYQKNFFELERSVQTKNFLNLILIDFLYLKDQYNNQVFNLKRWYLSKNCFTSDFEIYLTEKILSILNLAFHKRKKAIFVDLDDTLWGGTIAEDSFKDIKLGNMNPEGEAFQNFQGLLKNYSKTGIILGIISRNFESKAIKFISSHPEMVLKKNDFAGWKINFKRKSENIKTLCKELNINPDSVVYIDNSSYERKEVEDNLEGVSVLDIGENVFDYSNKLRNSLDLNYINLSKEDFKRAENYSQIRNLNESRKNFIDHESWLKSLKMKINFEKFNKLQLERYHQMYNKINQINLSTRRLGKERIKLEVSNKTKFVTMRVEDKVSNLGIIGLLSFHQKKKLVVFKDFLFSCRALGRDLEKYFLTKIVNNLYDNKIKEIKFNFKKSAKNKLCEDILNSLSINKKNNFTIKKKLKRVYKKKIFYKEVSNFKSNIL